MTFTDCWIETVDDEDFSAYIAEQARLGVRRALRLDLLPRLPAAQHYWIPVCRNGRPRAGCPLTTSTRYGSGSPLPVPSSWIS